MVHSSRASIIGWAVGIIGVATVVSGCWVHDGRGPRYDHHEERREEHREEHHHEEHHH